MIDRLVNVPTADSKLEIRPLVDGDTIKIVCAVRNAAPDDYSIITSSFIGSHMMEKPQLLREMYARDIASVIEWARDIGYRQAQTHIQQVLGIAK
ncbi:hypothetical protein ACVIGB_000816 [Bradyrhizobium sp. USDA 4341]